MFGGRARKRVKSKRSWIGSVTTIDRVFPTERTSPPQPPATAQPRPPRAAHGGTRVPIGRNSGGHGEAGMESEEGTALEFLPRRKPCRNTADQAFLPSINLKSAVSCLAGASSVCSCEPRRKLYGSLRIPSQQAAGQVIARGDRRWPHPGSNNSGFSASFDRRIAESSGLRRLAVPCATNEMCENCFR